ncbi:MAG: biotin--[acetyl-CoA-carboxylase] ligase [Bacteroidetes bacterium]|nr:biotin--[acetyl-CoA-carboxylase] ligase [Bacteroidota bacterium]
MIGSNILSFENLTSTNTYASGLLKSEVVQEGTIIRASFQSAGRGQTGNGWESEAGKNLLISIILYPTAISPADQFLISRVISLGITDFLGKELQECKIKWPNDIYVRNDKIAGILIENSVMDNKLVSSIVGIGLNINQRKFTGNAPNPVSMTILTGKEYDTDNCLTELSMAIDKRYDLLMKGKNEIICSDYISKLYRKNEWFGFRDKDGIFKGKIVSVTEEGLLLIEHPDRKIREYAFKEVDFIL